MYGVKVLDCSVALEAGDHLAVASAVEVPPLASRLARVVDSCGIMEMNSAQNTKRTRFEHLCPPQVRTIKMAPRVGFEPTTLRLTAGCSAVELPRNFFGALRFLGARKYYRHFNFRRNPLF